MKKLLVAWMIIGGLAAFAVWLPYNSHREQLIGAARTPEEIVTAMLDRRTPKVTRRGSDLSVGYDLGPQVTNGTAIFIFNFDVADLVPMVFAKSSDIESIGLIAMAGFKDLKGNRYSHPAFRVRFSRSNSSSVQWDNNSLSNIPKIADAYWAHPSFSRD